MTSSAPARAHLPGLDWLRAGLSIAVVLWHMKAFGRSALLHGDRFDAYSPTFLDVLYFQGTLLAVPAFIALSCVLLHRGGASAASWERRVSRLLVLLLVWPIAHWLVSGGVSALVDYLARSGPRGWLLFLVSGGHTVYYFFFALLFCLTASWLVARLPVWAQGVLFAGSSLGLIGLLWLGTSSGSPLWTIYYDPLNFLPYAFGAPLVVSLASRASPRALGAVVLGMLAGYAAVSAWEWTAWVDPAFVAGNRTSFPAYTRPSLVLGSFALVLGALGIRRASPAWIRFLSERSLALYCLHPILMTLFSGTPLRPGLGWVWWAPAVIIGGSYAIAFLLERLGLRRGWLL